jgi:hypothetical protein
VLVGALVGGLLIVGGANPPSYQSGGSGVRVIIFGSVYGPQISTIDIALNEENNHFC